MWIKLGQHTGSRPAPSPTRSAPAQETSGHPRCVPPPQVRAQQVVSVESAAAGTCTLAPRGVTAPEWPSLEGRWLG